MTNADEEEPIEKNVVGVWERPCPRQDCDGSVALLEGLNVWLCSGDSDHAWPKDHWELPA
jgi:hypothetical protein